MLRCVSGGNFCIHVLCLTKPRESAAHSGVGCSASLPLAALPRWVAFASLLVTVTAVNLASLFGGEPLHCPTAAKAAFVRREPSAPLVLEQWGGLNTPPAFWVLTFPLRCLDQLTTSLRGEGGDSLLGGWLSPAHEKLF